MIDKNLDITELEDFKNILDKNDYKIEDFDIKTDDKTKYLGLNPVPIQIEVIITYKTDKKKSYQGG